MNAVLQTLYLAFVTSLGIAVFLSVIGIRPWLAAGCFLLCFLADLMTPNPVDFLSLTLVSVFLAVFFHCAGQETWLNALYTTGAAVAAHTFCVVLAGLPVWSFFPELYNTPVYTYGVGILQCVLMLLFAFLVRGRFYHRFTDFEKHWITVAEYGLLLYLTVAYPLLIRMLGVRYTEFCRLLTTFNTIFTYVLFASGLLTILCLSVYKAAVHSCKQLHLYESQSRIVRGLVYIQDWKGLQAYYASKESTAAAPPAEGLEAIRPGMLRAVVNLLLQEAQERDIKLRLTVDGEMDAIKMDMQALCDVINLYAQNCLNHCISMQEQGLVPEIELLFERRLLGVKITMRNTAADEKAALEAIWNKRKVKRGPHGYGIALSSSIAARQPNCTQTRTVQNGWYEETLTISDHVEPFVKTGFAERLAIRHGEMTLADNVKKGSMEYELQVNRVKFIYFNIVKLAPFLLLTALLHIFFESVFVLLLVIPLGKQARGIHFDSDLACFTYSVISFLATVYLSIYLPLPWYAILIAWTILVVIYCQYAPCGHTGRPVMESERQILKKNSVFILCIFCLCALIGALLLPDAAANRFMRSALVYVCVAEAVNLLPLTYKIFHVRRW